MAARRSDACGFETRRPRAHHDDLPRRTIAARDLMRHRRFASGRRIVDAQRFPGKIDAVDAIAHADAGADLVLATLRHLFRDMRVRDMGARHADHVELACGDRVARGGDVLNTRRVEHRQTRRRAHLA